MKKKFIIECEMEERWVNNFVSMLKFMEYLGKIGSSQYVVLFSDGDGDFRPKFDVNIKIDEVKPETYIADDGNFINIFDVS